jgi:hypothetical protein
MAKLYIISVLKSATLVLVGMVDKLLILRVFGMQISTRQSVEQFVQQHGGFLPTSARKLVSTKKEEKWYKQKKILIQVFGSD